MKQPEFRIRKVSGENRDYFYLEQRGRWWGWNQIERMSYYEHSEYDYNSIEACEKRIKEILRARKPDVIVKEINTDFPFTPS